MVVIKNEAKRREVTAGEDGRVFEHSDGTIEKEYRDKSLGFEIKRDTVSELKSLYYLYKLAKHVMPDHFIDTLGSEQKDGKLRLYTKKVEIPDEDKRFKNLINEKIQAAHAGEISEAEAKRVIKDYEMFIEEKYPEAKALAEEFKKNGLQIPHWQVNMLFDDKDKKVKFCEVERSRGKDTREFTHLYSLMAEASDPEDQMKRLYLFCQSFLHYEFINIERKIEPHEVEKAKELLKTILETLDQLIRLFQKFKEINSFSESDDCEVTLRIFMIDSKFRRAGSLDVLNQAYEELLSEMKADYNKRSFFGSQKYATLLHHKLK
ncbi:MAG: hypothetical protein ABID45_01785 [Patescibacteria group bacterium]